MPSVWPNKCEWYPIYEPYPEGYEDCAQTEVPQEFLDRWTTCKAEFAALQRAFCVLYEGSLPGEHDLLLAAEEC